MESSIRRKSDCPYVKMDKIPITDKAERTITEVYYIIAVSSVSIWNCP
jgi:hypothetical protein